MKNQTKILIGILIGSTLLSGCVTESKIVDKEVVNVVNNEDKTPESTPIKIEAKITEEKLVNNTEFLTSSISYPVISGLQDKALEARLNAWFKKDAVDFVASLENAAKADFENSKANTSYQFIKHEASVEFSVRYNKDNILSIISLFYQYTGGAHGSSNQLSYNINLETGQELLVSDLFSKDFDYKKVLIDDILASIGAEPDNYFDEAAKTIHEMDDRVLYYIEEGNIVLYYTQYEIAPYASGIPEFKVPFSKLKFKSDLKL